MNKTAVFLSRIQFALTAMYHFLFVALTIGLIWLIAMMETIHAITKKDILVKNDKVLGEAFWY
jgi:cytochrome d ubiquinol oxidase subunit I